MNVLALDAQQVMKFNLEVNHSDNPCALNELHVDFSEKSVKARLCSYTFEDHGFIMLYIPSLNLSAYGDSVEEAQEMMTDTILPDFLLALTKLPKSAAFEHLSKLGWSAKGRQSEDFQNIAYVDKEGILRNFDLPQDTPIQEQLVTV